MSGIVERVGANVKHVRPGDRVWTSTYYRDVRAGCFQEYVVVPQHTVLPIPSLLSDEEAACLGVAALTAAMTLWKWLDVPMPQEPSTPNLSRRSSSKSAFDSLHMSSNTSEDSLPTAEVVEEGERWLLIYGGSTITGQFATQIARFSNLRILTVCSARTAALSKSLGATYVVIRDNRSNDEILEEIATTTKGNIRYAIDLVGPSTAAMCIQACSTAAQKETLGQEKVPFAPLAMMSSKQEVPECVEAHNVEMKRFVLDTSSGVYAFELNKLLESGSLKLPQIEVLEGGLNAIQSGLELLKKGDMGGRKLVVKM